jgi:hypothetical protein
MLHATTWGALDTRSNECTRCEGAGVRVGSHSHSVSEIQRYSRWKNECTHLGR